jgi:hypothetical protein
MLLLKEIAHLLRVCAVSDHCKLLRRCLDKKIGYMEQKSERIKILKIDKTSAYFFQELDEFD